MSGGGGGRGGGWGVCENIVTIFSPQGENIVGWKYRLTPALAAYILC